MTLGSDESALDEPASGECCLRFLGVLGGATWVSPEQLRLRTHRRSWVGPVSSTRGFCVPRMSCPVLFCWGTLRLVPSSLSLAGGGLTLLFSSRWPPSLGASAGGATQAMLRSLLPGALGLLTRPPADLLSQGRGLGAPASVSPTFEGSSSLFPSGPLASFSWKEKG